MKTRRRQDASYVRHFTSFQRHIVLLEIVALVNSKKNRNIKANDVNLHLNGQEYRLLFQNNVHRYVFVLQIDRTLLSMFCTWSVTLWKKVSREPLSPSEITAFEPPLPLGISNDLPWGEGGVWIFSGTTHSTKTNKIVFPCQMLYH